ncbi:MAG TPA: hypothetical protein VGR27_05960, partial [Longimicrobiaceae bacterium]|nr:hypothetical protein [Longimicrobiaceae bacterium]
ERERRQRLQQELEELERRAEQAPRAREGRAAETALERELREERERRQRLQQEIEELERRAEQAPAPRATEAAVSPAEMREIVRDAVRQELAREGTTRTPAPSRAAPARTQAAPAADAGLSRAEMRELIREVIRQELEREGVTRPEGAAAPPATAPRAAVPATEPRAAAPALTEERLAQIEQRLAERVENVVAQRYGAVDPVTRQQTVVVPERSGSAAAAALVTEQRLDLLEQRLMARMDALVERRMREELERQRRIEGVGPAPAAEQAVVPRGTTPAAPASVPPPVDPSPTAASVRRPLTLDPERTRAFTGVSFADPQALLGARLNFGPITSSMPLDLVPEVTFGFGDGTSLLLAGNLQYEAGPLTRGTLLTPYVNGGLGLLTSEGLVLNLGYGVSADLGRSALGSVTGFAEHQGIDLYDLHRLLLGVRVRM